MTNITLYGIKNCDTVKKARKWLEQNSIDYTYHDFRLDGLKAETLSAWLNTIGAETLINKRSTTWKQLSDTEKQRITNGEALDIVLAQPTVIKRPVLMLANDTLVGFNEKIYTDQLLG
ncbi:ArsC family reductase [Teredinibacter purpureus]|uniref:ArsC family reductase n=1 Tax=Teredinibacter purpureus TaxID=2731756 RepID=UPI0005F7AE27|nr:ArsC family reductase [Teredinibacter purpureus]